MATKKEIGFSQSLRDALLTPVEFLPTNSVLLDLALGGGWGRGKVGNIMGKESASKTLLALEVAGAFTTKFQDGIVVYDDAEKALEIVWAAKTFGLDVDRTFLERSETVETFQDTCIKWLEKSIIPKKCKKKNGKQKQETIPILYILDSLDALTTESELSDKMTMRTQVEKSILMSRFFRSFVSKQAKADFTLLVISQVRDKIGIMFGDSEDISGGKATKFYSSQRIKVSKVRSITKEKTFHGSKVRKVSGIDVKIQVVKNKLAEPHKEVTLPIYFKSGIGDLESCVTFVKRYTNKLGDSKKGFVFKGKEFGSLPEFMGFLPKKTSRLKTIEDYVRETWEKINNS